MYALGILLAAVSIEVASTSALPRTREFHDPLWSALVIAGFAVSMWLVTIVIRTMSVAVVGALCLGEQLTVARALCLGLIIAGVVGLNLVTA